MVPMVTRVEPDTRPAVQCRCPQSQLQTSHKQMVTKIKYGQ